jgi:formate dehydrogenase alpha subunit
MTNSIGEIKEADTIFVIGSNTTENHPVIGAYVKQAKKNGKKLIVADPRVTELAGKADVYMQLKPGSNVALLNAMMNVIIEEGLEAKQYIEERTENYDELKQTVKEYTPEKAEAITGVKADLIREAARLYAKAEKGSILYAMGITQHSSGTEHVFAIADLAMLCGNVGKESTGVNPLRGQNNVQGCCDVGCLAGSLPGYAKYTDQAAVEKFEKAWGVKLPEKTGLTVPEMMDAAHEGTVKMMYIMGENPMVSDPDLNHVEEALKNLDFLVVQDIFMTETAALADVVLPAASFAEKDGTFTNTERKVQRVRKAINPVGDSKSDWEIIAAIMNKLGYKADYKQAQDIMEEIAAVIPSYAGISYDRIETEGLHWPCPTKDHPGTKYLHKDKFARGKGLFKPVDYKAPAEQPDDEYPLILTTGRVLYHYHTGSMTRKVTGLNKKVPEAYVEISPNLAYTLGIQDQEKVQVSSRRGDIILKAKITSIVDDSTVFIPFHFAEAAANKLTNKAIDKIAKIPELKVCAVKIQKI